MPLLSISGQTAIANLRGNRASLWPDGRRDRSRLSGVASVEARPSFELTPGEAIFTMGSCFARNIEQRLEDLGYEIPTRTLKLPAEERVSDTENDILNKYAPHSILNEVRWAIEPGAKFPDNGLLGLRERKWHDPHLAPNIKPTTRNRVLERRAAVQALHREIPRCRILIMTLGLVEAWFDEDTQLYLNGAPPGPALGDDPSRFRLDVLTVDDVVGVLNELHDLLTRYGHPEWRMLLTVSPVPFKSTFTGQDAITANTYSKSALRVAAEMFTLAHDNVDYFPSYEIVTHTLRTSAFIEDNRHVNNDVVTAIVGKVEKAYSPGEGEEAETRGAIRTGSRVREALKAGNHPEAVRLFASLENRNRYLKAGWDEFNFRYEYGRALARCDFKAEAQAQLSHAVRLNPNSIGAVYNLGLLLARLGRPLDAEEVFQRAVELEPENMDRRSRYVVQLIVNGKVEAAAAGLTEILERQPGHEGALNALAELGLEAAPQVDASPSGSLSRLFAKLRKDIGEAKPIDTATLNAAADALRHSMTAAPARTA